MGTSIKVVDQGSILLVVYSAFSGAVVAGLWSQMPLPAMASLFVLCALLPAAMALCVFASRRLGFSTEDESPSVLRRTKAWSAAFPWPRCCSLPAWSAASCCR
jgi:predicted Na+-dependent transporter